MIKKIRKIAIIYPTLAFALFLPNTVLAGCYPFTFIFNTPTQVVAITMGENCSFVVTTADR